MDRKSWPWRKKGSNNNTTIIMSTHTGLHSALDISLPNSGSVSPAIVASPETCVVDKKPALPMLAAAEKEKKKSLFLLENATALEALAWKEQAEQQLKTLVGKLEDAERESVNKEAMVKQHAKVAEDAVSGWEKAESDAVAAKQELAASMQQQGMLEVRVAELDEALKLSMKAMKQAQEEQQQRTRDVIDKKMQEWGKMKADMEAAEEDLRQRMLAAEAQNCAMSKSLEERARAITEWQEGKERAEMEAGLLQVKLESQATEMAEVRYELRVLSKELEIRHQENECSRRAADAAHKQHLEDVKKLMKLDSECQRLRNLVRKRLPGPAAIAQMKMEAEKSEQSKRRRSLGSSGSYRPAGMCEGHPSSHQQGASITENAASCQDMAQKLLAMEEENKFLKEMLAKKNTELHSARQMCARTANKLSVAEDQLESLQGTPTSVGSTQMSTLESFIRQSQATNGANSEKLDDEVSCAESWASALITELAHFKKVKQSTDVCGVDSTNDGIHDTANTPLTESFEKQNQTSSPPAGDCATLKTLATKEAQLQLANFMCKDAMAKLASAEAKLGGTWISENPRSNVKESVNTVGEVHAVMSKLDRILDDMRIAVASVGDATDDDNSDNGMNSPLLKGQPQSTVALAAFGDSGSIKAQVEMQAKKIDEMQTQVDASEAAKAELERQLQAMEKELQLIKSELEDVKTQAKKLKESALELQNQQAKEVADEQAKRGEVQAELEAKRSEVNELESSIAALRGELANQWKEHEAVVAKCEALETKLRGYVDREHSMATSCRFEGESDARARKEREVAAAKEKLEECQRTILVLGKQLTAFTSPSSASFDSTMFDSTMSLHYGALNTNQDHEVDHAHKVHSRLHQRRPLSYNSVNPHDGSNHPSANSNTHISNFTKPLPQVNGSHYSKPRRIHSDLSYRAGSANPVAGMQYSVAEHLQMDDGVSSFYDSLPESATSSPSSQFTSPTNTFGNQRHMNRQGGGGGVRTNLAKSLERVAGAVPPREGANGRGGGGNGDVGKNAARSSGSAAEVVNKNGGNGGGGGKANKSLSRFFGRSKK